MAWPAAAPVEGGDASRDLPFVYTSFSVPPPINAKSEARWQHGPDPMTLLLISPTLPADISSQYLRTDSQTWIARTQGNPASNVQAAMRGIKRARLAQGDRDGDAGEEEVQTSDDDENGEEGSQKVSLQGTRRTAFIVLTCSAPGKYLFEHDRHSSRFDESANRPVF